MPGPRVVKNFEASIPSIGRSVGALSAASANAANVVYQSWAESISSVTIPAGTFPGQRTIAGTRIEPSHGGVMNDPRYGPFDPPWIAGMSPAALSLEKTMMRVVGDPGLLHAVHDLPDPVIHLGDEVRVLAQPIRGRLVEVRVHRLRRVHVREPDVGEERLVGFGLSR